MHDDGSARKSQECSGTADLRHDRRGAPPPPGAPGRRVPPVRAVRIRRGSGRPHHGSRPRQSGVVLGQPVRRPLRTDPRIRPGPGEPRGRGGAKATTRSTPPRLRSIRGSTRRVPTRWRRRTRTRCTARPGRRWAACSIRLRRTRARSTKITRCSTIIPAWSTRLPKATGSRNRWATRRPSSCAITGC